MKACLEIELIGDNMVQTFRMWTKVLNDGFPGLGDYTLGSLPPSGWVAEVTGIDPKYKYKRDFLRYRKDYSRSNSKGSRGVFAEYILESEKIYDVRDNKRRFFCKVTDEGDIVHIDESEVRELLKTV
jgi:hypothetical protein